MREKWWRKPIPKSDGLVRDAAGQLWTFAEVKAACGGPSPPSLQK